MGGRSSSSVWAPLFCFFCCVCHLFPVYVHRAAPACRAASPQHYVYYVYYVYGLAAPLNLSRLSEGAEFGFTVCVLVMMSGVSNQCDWPLFHCIAKVCLSVCESRGPCVGVSGVCFVVFGGFIDRA